MTYQVNFFFFFVIFFIETRNDATVNASFLSSSNSNSFNNNQSNNGGDEGNQFSEAESEFSDNNKPTIRLKFLDDTQRLVKTLLETSVGNFKR